jgi:hypothetical protein
MEHVPFKLMVMCSLLNEMHEKQLRLSFPPHGSSLTSSTLRLACQVQVQATFKLQKRTGFWEYDDLAEGSIPSAPLESWVLARRQIACR